jgi:hypothetical protein
MLTPTVKPLTDQQFIDSVDYDQLITAPTQKWR